MQFQLYITLLLSSIFAAPTPTPGGFGSILSLGGKLFGKKGASEAVSTVAKKEVTAKAPKTLVQKLKTEAIFAAGSAVALAGVSHLLGGKKPPVPGADVPLAGPDLPIPKAVSA